LRAPATIRICYRSLSEGRSLRALPRRVPWLASKLEKAFPNFKPEQVTRKTYSVGVKFTTTGTSSTQDLCESHR